MIPTKSRHSTEDAARAAARKLGNLECQIVESRDVTKNVTKHATGSTIEWVRGDVPVFYVERGEGMSMIRNWERLVFEGRGRSA